ncbi:hypothetical protein PRELSG_0022200 [Plasmodium relictum]|uniref:Uncharacterized protein n=1 Tax=Plasmodium relictum TaxID=85471 RepID=A0A1J1GK08_PLARL|nr:hypothetical protein PRELSG_0022200 [Plasmodium relictum]CRG84461.1 hypothetical protein PRELSG_0022200 [Plasmodium relictum]
MDPDRCPGKSSQIYLDHNINDKSGNTSSLVSFVSSSPEGQSCERITLPLPRAHHFALKDEESSFLVTAILVFIIMLKYIKVEFKHKILSRKVIGHAGNLVIEIREEVDTLELSLKDNFENPNPPSTQNKRDENEDRTSNKDSISCNANETKLRHNSKKKKIDLD